MGYIYDSIVSSLGGKKLTSALKDGSIIRDWSPNSFKRFILLTDGIIIQYHLGNRIKQNKFDIIKVAQELNEGIKKNPLSPLYSFKALSCLEEVIISNALVKEEFVSQYMNTLVNTHRLRAVVYAPSNLKVDDVVPILEKLPADASISDMWQGMKSKKTEGFYDYYNRFYLRPTYYALDREGGALSNLFNKIKSDIEAKKSKVEEVNRVVEFLKYDENNKNFWLQVVKFLISDTSKDSNFTKFTEVLKSCSLANSGTYVKGLKEYFEEDQSRKKSTLYSLYGSLGYLTLSGGSDTPHGSGFFRKVENVANNAFHQIKKLVNKDTGYDLKSVKMVRKPDGEIDKVRLLTDVLVLINKGGTVGKENEERVSKEDKLEEIRENILKVLPEDFIIALHDVIEASERSFESVTLSRLGNKDDSLKVSAKALRKLGLNRHEEVLSPLGYCGGTANLSVLGSIPFEDKLNELARMSITTMKDNKEQAWLRLSNLDKCKFIIAKLDERERR